MLPAARRRRRRRNILASARVSVFFLFSLVDTCSPHVVLCFFRLWKPLREGRLDDLDGIWKLSWVIMSLIVGRVDRLGKVFDVVLGVRMDLGCLGWI